jgi:protein gp37
MLPEWVDLLHDVCRQADVAFFFKQWGTHNAQGQRVGKQKAGREYKDRHWDEMPKALALDS